MSFLYNTIVLYIFSNHDILSMLNFVELFVKAGEEILHFIIFTFKRYAKKTLFKYMASNTQPLI